jgi:hypothetical protein
LEPILTIPLTWNTQLRLLFNTMGGRGIQVSSCCDAGADIDQSGQGPVLPDQQQAGRRRQDGKALAWRIGLSVALFVLLIVAFYNGWIHPPHTVPGYNQ